MGKAKRLLDRCVRSPMRALCWVRDLYVRSVTELPGSVLHGAAMGCASFGAMAPSYHFPTEWMSTQDTRGVSRPRAEAPGSRGAKAQVAPLSQRVMLETIDEDKPCDFGGDVRMGAGLLLGRSRRCHAGGQRRLRTYA